ASHPTHYPLPRPTGFKPHTSHIANPIGLTPHILHTASPHIDLIPNILYAATSQFSPPSPVLLNFTLPLLRDAAHNPFTFNAANNFNTSLITHCNCPWLLHTPPTVFNLNDKRRSLMCISTPPSA
ncbi:hypothetical protein AVEN_79394-1, partial [Araneus ventricosus]